jgi:hypothetical protein
VDTIAELILLENFSSWRNTTRDLMISSQTRQIGSDEEIPERQLTRREKYQSNKCGDEVLIPARALYVFRHLLIN